MSLLYIHNVLLNFRIDRPEVTEECSSELECDNGAWFVSAWAKCSSTRCGGEEGTKNRRVFCMKGGAQTDPGECSEDEMPPEDAPCQPECSVEDEEEESSGSGSGDQPDKDADVEEGNKY